MVSRGRKLGKEDIARLMQVIGEPDEDSSIRALQAIDNIAENKPKELYDELKDILTSFYDDMNLYEIIRALSWYVKEEHMYHPEPIVKALASVLMDRECFSELIDMYDPIERVWEVRKLVLEALEFIGEAYPDLVNRPLLKAIVRYIDEGDPEDDDMACRAVSVVGSIASDDEKTVTVLRKVLKQSDDFPEIREEAVKALWYIGENWEVEPAINAVARALEDEDPGVRECALEALESISRFSPEPVVGNLVKMLGKGDNKLRRKIAVMLTEISSDEPELVMKRLVKALNSSNKEVRRLAVKLLRQVG